MAAAGMARGGMVRGGCSQTRETGRGSQVCQVRSKQVEPSPQRLVKGGVQADVSPRAKLNNDEGR
jgi:hypothetical protein